MVYSLLVIQAYLYWIITYTLQIASSHMYVYIYVHEYAMLNFYSDFYKAYTISIMLAQF